MPKSPYQDHEDLLVERAKDAQKSLILAGIQAREAENHALSLEAIASKRGNGIVRSATRTKREKLKAFLEDISILHNHLKDLIA
jgi:hypothetical protein